MNNAPIWQELNLKVGEKAINIHVTADGPNALFINKNRKDIPSRIMSIIKLTSEEYQTDLIKWIIVDSNSNAPYDDNLSSCSICRIDADRIDEYLATESKRRQSIFWRGKRCNTCSQYIREYMKGNVAEKVEEVIVIIPDISQLIKFELEFYSLMMLSRTLGFHFLFFSTYDEQAENSIIQTSIRPITRTIYDFDNEGNEDISINNFPNKQNGSEADYTIKKWSWKVSNGTGNEKNINIVCADLCDSQDEYDVVACSSYKNEYIPTKNSLVGSLLRKKEINLADLSMNPEIDLRSMGCWLSTVTGTSFHRIACVELLSHILDDCESNVDIILQKSFSTLNFLLKQAFLSNICIHAIAMNLLGTGDQAIELSYVLATLISHCKDILENNNGVNEITIYEPDFEKVLVIVDAFNNAFSLASSKPKLFISYSSKQIELATKIRDQLEKNDISCWMAPYSIPAGSSYQELIPAALSQVEAVVLILSPDAEESRWVQKEIGTAIGANKIIVPYSIGSYDISKRFKFLLDGEQILFDNSTCYKNEFIALVNRIKELLKINNLSITYDTVKSSKHNWLKLSLIFLIIATIFIIAGTTIQFLGLVDIVSILKNLLF